jgi:hypothetical protein
MRRLVVAALMSLDGVVSAPERLLPLWDEENKRYAVSEFTEFDALLFGRVTCRRPRRFSGLGARGRRREGHPNRRRPTPILQYLNAGRSRSVSG